MYLYASLWCTYMFICDILTCLFVVYLWTYLQCTYVFICNILTYLFAVYLRIYLRCTYLLFYLKIIVWCVGIIINFYCSTHPSLTPEYWKKILLIFYDYYCRECLTKLLISGSPSAICAGGWLRQMLLGEKYIFLYKLWWNWLYVAPCKGRGGGWLPRRLPGKRLRDLFPVNSGGKLCNKLLRSRSRIYFIWDWSRIIYEDPEPKYLWGSGAKFIYDDLEPKFILEPELNC